jgi:glyoxylase-like metal-dependent hydrolase (beta-lactamase superfamily II)
MRRVLRVLKYLALVLLVLVVAVVATVALSFAGSAPVVDGAEVAPGVRTVKDGFTSSFLVDAGPGQVVLVDAGNDPAATPILAELTRRGLGAEAVAAIFLTHGHGDHVGGVPRFPRAAVYALGPDVALAEGRAGSHGVLTRLMSAKRRGFTITRGLKDREEVTVGALTVTAFAVPGHTGGSAAYLAAGVLFLGDSADSMKDGRLSGAKKIFSDDPAQNRASLRAFAAVLAPRGAEIRALAFAHSGPLAGLGPLAAFAARP